jgi:hypothetical protein
MDLGSQSRLPRKCFFKDCPSRLGGPVSVHLVRDGSFHRTSDSRRIPRFRCRICKRSFSSASYSPCYRQLRRRLNVPILHWAVSGVSQRRLASRLKTTRKTIARKSRFMLGMAKKERDKLLASYRADGKQIDCVQFDEMESFERSKCLPVSIPIIVEPKKRKILAIGVCSMPAKGPLAEFSRKKYGPRADEREETARRLIGTLSGVVRQDAIWITDKKTSYSTWIKSVFPNFRHNPQKGRRGCTVGYGELKEGGFDPLFSLNHTAAMIRANVNRMFRRTWCTTKKREWLETHLLLYAYYHNTALT